MNKEQIYDDQISGLMAQIIDICKANKIAVVASFAVPNDEDPDLLCSTILLQEDTNAPAEFFEVRDILYPARQPRPMMGLTITKADGSVIKEVILP